MNISNPLIILSVKMSVAKNNSPYATLRVKDDSHDFQINIWATPRPCPFKVGNLITLDSVDEKNGFFSTKFENTYTSIPPKDSPLLQYLSPVPTSQDWFNLFEKFKSLLSDSDQAFIFLQFKVLFELYKNKVAARSNHHNYPGGLLEHTYELLNIFHHVLPALPYKVNPFVVILGCLYHDFGKVSEYDENTELTSDFYLQGHPYIGARAVSVVLQKADYPDSIIRHCQHAVLAHHGYKQYGSPVVPSSPEAFTVHMCDLWSGWGVEYENPQGTSISVFGESIQVQHLPSEE